MRIPSSTPIGRTIATVIAIDSDGSPPNNQLRYEIVGPGRAGLFFRVDPGNGVVQIKDDLRKDMEREYKVCI